LLPLDRRTIKSIAVVGPNADAEVFSGGGSAQPRVFKATSIRAGIAQIAGETINVLSSRDPKEAVRLARQADVAIVSVGFNAGLEYEGLDRPFELPMGQVDLIRAVTAANPRTIVVINSGGGVAWAGWLGNAPAVLQAWYSGQESGRAVAEILFGDVNPSGKLPATFERQLADNPAIPYYHQKTSGRTSYGEGIFVGYRGYDNNHIEPQFCFGHGLSYTTFYYGKATVTPSQIPPNGQVTVCVDVKNSGERAGDEIVQLYIHQVECSVKRPVKELRGFERVSLKPGEKKTVKITLTASQLAFYDVKTHGFVVEPGVYDVLMGASSKDIRSQSQVKVMTLNE
jgi:beta-glucosidase